VSFALGAFFAGMVLSESQLSQQAAQESLPLRDAFAVLFFVSVGMLFNPNVHLAGAAGAGGRRRHRAPGQIGGGVFRRALRVASADGDGVDDGREPGADRRILVHPDRGLRWSWAWSSRNARDLIVATSIISILVNPFFFAAAEWLARRVVAAAPKPVPGITQTAIAQPLITTSLSGHTVLVGYGRVGGNIGQELKGKRSW